MADIDENVSEKKPTGYDRWKQLKFKKQANPSFNNIFNMPAQIHHHYHSHVHQYQDHGHGLHDSSNEEDNFLPWEPGFPRFRSNLYDDEGKIQQHVGHGINQVHELVRSQSQENIAGMDKGIRDFFHIDKIAWKSFFSVIALAVMRSTGKTYALKMINKNCKKIGQNQMLTEVKVLEMCAKKCHFICQFHSAFQTRTNCYIVMEYIEGGSLEDRLARIKTYPESVTVFYMAEICLGLFFLHSLGIIHRDLRLRNVMIKRDGHLRLIDFGLSKMNMRENFTVTFVGAPKEIAPEIHQTSPYNKSVDYWALGIMLYTLLHGELPFQGKTRVAIFTAVTMEIESYSPVLGGDTVNLCKSLLTKNQRYRLGFNEESEVLMKTHPYFKDVDWGRMGRRHYAPPYLPLSESQNELPEFIWPDLGQQNSVFRSTHPIRLKNTHEGLLLEKLKNKELSKIQKFSKAEKQPLKPGAECQSVSSLTEVASLGRRLTGNRISLDLDLLELEMQSRANLFHKSLDSTSSENQHFVDDESPPPERKDGCLRRCLNCCSMCCKDCDRSCKMEKMTCKLLCCGLEDTVETPKLDLQRKTKKARTWVIVLRLLGLWRRGQKGTRSPQRRRRTVATPYRNIRSEPMEQRFVMPSSLTPTTATSLDCTPVDPMYMPTTRL